MKTKLQTTLATIAPSISIETTWEHDDEMRDIREDCDGHDDENPDDWQAWQSAVTATIIQGGDAISASNYMGGTWEKAGDNPAGSNPTISGYERDMTHTALSALQKLAPCAEILAALIHLEA